MPQFDMNQLKKLCRIEFSKEEEQSLEESLNRVLEYVHKLNEVDTENVKPCRFVHPSLHNTTLREDIPKEPLSREQFLSNAPDQIGGMIKTPPVLTAKK
jgi:aspartyl-tRNA(Asn)/glutamyl-tRNA(Gln) amidotransferase subunit C